MTNRADLDYYYSSDTTLTGTGNDIRVSGDPINPLDPDATEDLTQYITAPTAPGVYYYGVCISDVDGEQNLANNCSPTGQVLQITVDPTASVVDGRDLYIPEIRFKLRDATKVESPVLLPSERFRIYLTVGNRGKSDDDHDTRRIYFLSSPDAHIDGWRKGNEQALDIIYLRTLRAGRTKIRQSPLIEASDTPGIYYYGAEVQATSRERREGNDANNVSAAATLIVNKVPTTANTFSPQTLTVGEPSVSLDLNTYFADDESLTYTAVLVPATPEVVELRVSGSILELIPQQAGTANVKVTAKDPYFSAEDTRWQAEQVFAVTVSAPEVPVSQPHNLVVESLRASKTLVDPGESFRLTAVVRNQGTATSTPLVLDYYHLVESNAYYDLYDVNISVGDAPFETQEMAALTTDSSRESWIQLTAPDAPGTYYYRVCVYPVGASDTTDTCSEAIAITVEGADLMIEGVPQVSKTTVTAGETFQIDTRVWNKGKVHSDPTTLRYYRSTDATISPEDMEVGTDRVALLTGRGSHASNRRAELSNTVPALDTPGVYYYGVCVDAVPGDPDITNNCSQAIAITVEKPPVPSETSPEPNAGDIEGPDLIFSMARVDSTTVKPGRSVRLHITLKNQGTRPAPATLIRYYRSTDATITAEDTELRAVPVGALGSGKSQTTWGLLPSPFSSGVYYYGACVDAVTAEFDTTNNCSDALEVAVERPGDKKPLLVAVGTIPTQALEVGDAPVVLNVSGYFVGSVEQWRVSSSQPSVVTASLSGSEITLTAVSDGWAAVTILASKSDVRVSQILYVSVGGVEIPEHELAVLIPDANLRAAVRTALELEPGDTLTEQEMLGLRTLSASGASISDLTGLEYMRALTSLSLGTNQIRDLTPLENLWNLTELILEKNEEIVDLTPLENLRNLRHLDLDVNKIVDLTPLENLTSLTNLSLEGNQVSNVYPLRNLKHLTVLYLQENSISDISSLAGLTSLTRLWLYDNNISDISPLSSLTALTVLDLSVNSISDISALSSLTALTELWLYDNNISDISALSSLTALTALDLSENSTISDISALSSLTALRHLGIIHLTSLTDITALESLTTLESLVFSEDMDLDGDSINKIWDNNPGVRMDGITIVAAPAPFLMVEPSAPVLPDETALLPNYPNPFNPETWIPYQLAEAADVTLTIYDARGVVVRRLALGHQPAGFYHGRGRAAYWDGRNEIGEKVASGLYFYTFTAGDFTATQKLLIRK